MGGVVGVGLLGVGLLGGIVGVVVGGIVGLDGVMDVSGMVEGVDGMVDAPAVSRGAVVLSTMALSVALPLIVRSGVPLLSVSDVCVLLHAAARRIVEAAARP